MIYVLKIKKRLEKIFILGAKTFRQLPETYALSEESIIKSYVEQINKFMRSYNEQYLNIQTHIQRAEEQQKVFMFKSCKLSNDKKLFMLTEEYEKFKNKKTNMIDEYKRTNNIELYKEIQNLKDPSEKYNKEINSLKNKIKLYENLINRCDIEFSECKTRRERDFKELFEPEKAVAVNEKLSLYKRITRNLLNKLNGESKFSKLVIKKYADKINDLKVQKLDKYIDNIKRDTVIFSEEIEKMAAEL